MAKKVTTAKVTVRGLGPGQMTPEECREFCLWAWESRSRFEFDKNVLNYPRVAMLIAEDTDGAVAYSHAQTTIMVESFVPMPGASNRKRTRALKKFDTALQEIARASNIGDVYCYVPMTEEKYADQLSRSGWVEIPTVRLFKKPTGIKVK